MMGQFLSRVKFETVALLAALAIVIGGLGVPQSAAAQEAEGEEATATATEAVGGYVPMAPTADKGMPTDPREPGEGNFLKSLTFQDQYTEDGAYALWMHDVILLPIITFISLFVLGLLFYVIFRFNRRTNPVPSKTTHNTLIEVVWTVVPVLILVVIAVPSIGLLASQYETPPEDAVTIKATGYQWYWGYTYPDHGDVEIISNMMDEDEAVRNGEPPQLAVDNRMVVPAGVPLRIQVTAADVIHAFAVPSLWFKMDAVPGRLNEKLLTIEEPGVYYGQCSELCGTRHAYMPIAVEALPMEEFEAWVLEQPGGTLPGQEEAEAEASPAQEEAELEAGEEAAAEPSA